MAADQAYPSTTPANSAPTARPTPTSPLNWVMLVAGVLLAAFGIGMVATGLLLLAAEASQRDGRYAYTDTEQVQTVGHAITTAPVTVDLGDATASGGALGMDDLLSVQLRATPVVPGQDVFIGIAAASDVETYLRDVPHAVFGDNPWDDGYVVSDPQQWVMGSDPSDALDEVPGTRAPEPPTEQDFWAQSATGSDQQTITLELQSGDWVLVLMNADGSRPVWVDVQAGAHTDLFGLANPGVLISGIVALVLGLPLILLGAAGLGRDIDRGPGAGAAGANATGSTAGAAMGAPGGAGVGSGARIGPDPLRLTGHLDPGVSRAMWLIKWALAIPHYIVLGLLWAALGVVTIFSFFAILITGRYPRSLFMFTVGVLRWNWRVGFYAYSALGTDRYPPFALAPAGYPAELDVVYPERLSRGLVLVKWWLLAIPHLLIVGIFTGSGAAVSSASERGGAGWSISLLSLLVLVAAIGLLFTGRYLPGLFDLIIGLNRWANRVGSYVLLLRDEYPPFRLDQGPEEPVSVDPGTPGTDVAT